MLVNGWLGDALRDAIAPKSRLGYWTGDGTLRDPHLFGIHAEDGTRIPGTANNHRWSGAKGKINSRVDFTPDTDGIYHLVAGAARTRLSNSLPITTRTPSHCGYPPTTRPL